LRGGGGKAVGRLKKGKREGRKTSESGKDDIELECAKKLRRRVKEKEGESWWKIRRDIVIGEKKERGGDNEKKEGRKKKHSHQSGK